MLARTKEARAVLSRCVADNGIWASEDRYKQQCWTRDFCLAQYPIMKTEFPAAVSAHLNNLARRQGRWLNSNGKIPILFISDEEQFLKHKFLDSFNNGKIGFMLQRWLDDGMEGIHNLTPNTCDSEALFIITVDDFLRKMPGIFPGNEGMYLKDQLRHAQSKAMYYLMAHLHLTGLIVGGDWRDTRVDLQDKCVLTNACLLYMAFKSTNYCMNGKYPIPVEQSQKVFEIINTKFWNGTYYDDYLGDDRGKNFDLLGNALAILYDIATPSQADSIINYAIKNLHTPHGFKLIDTFLPPRNDEEKKIMERDGAVIWPWIHCYFLLAMLHADEKKWFSFVQEGMKRMSEDDCFHEWLDVTTGKGYGSASQCWSAALFLRVEKCLGECELAAIHRKNQLLFL